MSGERKEGRVVEVVCPFCKASGMDCNPCDGSTTLFVRLGPLETALLALGEATIAREGAQEAVRTGPYGPGHDVEWARLEAALIVARGDEVKAILEVRRLSPRDPGGAKNG